MRREMMAERVRAGETWDILIIGGGATGLGAALDAASRGYRTLLLEGRDFAKGTSSRSTKLIHGGVRYLARGEIGLVREALRERGLLKRNAPHLVHDLGFLVPAYNWWSLPLYGTGLKLYDILAGGLGLGASRWLSSREALTRIPTLESKGLWGGILYHDGQFDDARLAIALLRTFLDLGGVALNYTPVISLLKNGERIVGAWARDTEAGEEFAVRARAVVNATGVFADEVRRLDDATSAPMLRPSQGTHLVLDRRFLPGETAIMVPSTDDGRVVFAIPWHGRTLVGTTDTPVDRPVAEPRPLAEEVDFLLEHAGRYLQEAPRPSDVLSAFAGLRPLIGAGGEAKTARLSREHALVVSPSGLVTITGGKWTTYRVMGADAIDQAAAVGSLPRKPSATASVRLHGWTDSPGPEVRTGYGSDSAAVDRVCREITGGDEPIHPNLPYRVGEVAWAARDEMARTVEDVLARRTRSLFLDARASREAAPRVAEVLGRELDRDLAWQEEQVRNYRELAERYLLDGILRAPRPR